MVGLIFYCIGAILAFSLMRAMFFDFEDKRESGMIIVDTVLSWVTIIFLLYKVYTEIK